MKAMEQQLDELERAANEVLTHKGLPGNFGMSGLAPNMPGGASADAAAKLETLKAKGAFGALQEMRNASKTGGALGNVSDKEGALLQNSMAPLGKAQSVGQVQQSLRDIIRHVQESKARIRAAYDDHWNNAGAAARHRRRPFDLAAGSARARETRREHHAARLARSRLDARASIMRCSRRCSPTRCCSTTRAAKSTTT